MSGLRSSYGTPAHPDGNASLPTNVRAIALRHPGYDDPINILLRLPALDIDGTIDHLTALAACCLISDNQNDGYLTEDREGLKKVEATVKFLPRDNYYFHVPNVRMYAIVPSFDDWQFPQKLPTIWCQCSIPPSVNRELPRSTTNAVLSRDVSCRVTKNREGTQIAHLVPIANGDWFERNDMSRFNTTGPELGLVGNQSNAILLRSDIHTIFDSKRFAIVPKGASKEPQSDPVLVAHTFERQSDSEVVELYHNVRLLPLSGVRIEFIYARFAMCVFEQLKISPFLSRMVPRTLRVWSKFEYVTRDCTEIECQNMVRQSRSRSISPKKRKQDESGAKDSDAFEEEVEWRGRKRHRSTSSQSRSRNNFSYPTPETLGDVVF